MPDLSFAQKLQSILLPDPLCSQLREALIGVQTMPDEWSIMFCFLLHACIDDSHVLSVTQDIEAVDPEYYKNLKWMLENNITDVLDLTFTEESDYFGKKELVELKPGGKDIRSAIQRIKLAKLCHAPTGLRDMIHLYCTSDCIAGTGSTYDAGQLCLAHSTLTSL